MIINYNNKDYININELKSVLKEDGDLSFDIKLNDPFFNCILFYENNEVIGYLSYDLIYDRIEIINIYILNKYRKNHIASKLIEFLINNNKTIVNITLEVNENNIAAINLYKKFGFKIVATREKYYGIFNGFLMEKEMMK